MTYVLQKIRNSEIIRKMESDFYISYENFKEIAVAAKNNMDVKMKLLEKN